MLVELFGIKVACLFIVKLFSKREKDRVSMVKNPDRNENTTKSQHDQKMNSSCQKKRDG